MIIRKTKMHQGKQSTAVRILELIWSLVDSRYHTKQNGNLRTYSISSNYFLIGSTFFQISSIRPQNFRIKIEPRSGILNNICICAYATVQNLFFMIYIFNLCIIHVHSL